VFGGYFSHVQLIFLNLAKQKIVLINHKKMNLKTLRPTKKKATQFQWGYFMVLNKFAEH
jgi:hypothetical protein